MILRSLGCLSLAIFTSCASIGEQTPSSIKGARHIVIDCSIYSMEGKLLRALPGKQCRFLSDGSWVSRDQKSEELVFHNKNLQEMWRVKSHFHHLLTLTKSNQLLATASSVHRFMKQKTRFDVLMLVNLEGQVVAQYDFFKNLPEIKKISDLEKHKLTPFDWDKGTISDVRVEFSHVNSIYEIPENPTVRRIPAFAKGNIVVNAMGLDAIYIFDPHLTHIIWTYRFVPESGRSLGINHDVQILSNGHLLIYANQLVRDGKIFSALIEFDPITEREVWRYESDPPENFSSKFCGGVQILENDHVFFSDTTHRSQAIEITRDGKKVRSISIERKGIQDAKQEDLGDFLKNSISP
jgi:hypothetical protein